MEHLKYAFVRDNAFVVRAEPRKFIHGTFSSLKIRNFRLYFIGQAISMSGTFMQMVAQSWLVLQLTNSGTALGLVTAMQFLPILILGPWGGVIADRFPKRKLIYVTQTLSGVFALILGILVATGLVRLWMVYVLSLLLGIISAVDNPVRQTFIFEMVGHDELRNAVTLSSTQVNLARVIGPILAGVLIATVGLAPCFILNALSYVAVLVVLYFMRASELRPVVPVPLAKGQLREGLNYVKSTPVVRDVLIMMAIIGMLTYEFQVSLPLLAQVTFHGDAGSYAALTAATGIGSVIGGLLLAGRKKTVPHTVVIAALLFGFTVLITSVMPTLALAMAALLLVGVFSIYFTSLGNTLIQLYSAPQMRGRVMAYWSMAFLGSTTIGGPIIGWIGQNVSPRWSLAVGGISAMIAAGWGWMTFRNVHALKNEPAKVVGEAESRAEGDVRVP